MGMGRLAQVSGDRPVLAEFAGAEPGHRLLQLSGATGDPGKGQETDRHDHRIFKKNKIISLFQEFEITDKFNLLKTQVLNGLKEIGGSFSAEHGIGTDKRDSLHHYASPSKIRLMKQIKHTFDPKGIMNPGKVV